MTISSTRKNVMECIGGDLHGFGFDDNSSPKHGLVYSCEMSAISAYICIAVKDAGKSLNVYGAWSIHRDFPVDYAPGMTPRAVPSKGWSKDKPIDGRFMFMLSHLWTEGETVSWTAGKSAEIALSVDDIQRKVRDFALPYFEGIDSEMG